MIGVIGCDGSPFHPAALELLRRAERIYGSREHLDALPPDCRAERLELNAGAIARLEEIAVGDTVFLASGDPLFHGIAGTLKRRGIEATVIPATTAFQRFFARLGQPWDDARLFSVHGTDAPLPGREILTAPLAVIYGGGGRTARRLALELLEFFPPGAERTAAAVCDLGLQDEFLFRGTLLEASRDARLERSLSLLALLPGGPRPVPPLPLGLPDGGYRHHKNMITHPEVRAVALAKLALIPGVMWDIGAGSGSVGLEAAGLCPGLEVHAVEKNPDRFAELEFNRRRAGVPGHHPHCGEFSLLAAQLPDPDRIFAGGGGDGLAGILETAFARLRPGGVLVATGVLVETVAVLAQVLKPHRWELLTLNISRAEPLGDGAYFRAENPITVAVYRKENP